MAPRFPFSAVVGHDDLRLALLLNAVHPAIGGVLVRGEKGTAKSTIVRALAALLPELDVVPDCRFACDPANPDPDCPDGPHADGVDRRPSRLVELPVGATEDRLVGSLDLERALTEGVRAYQPGLLAAAHRGVLYVDEVNLLHDHLVDLLLDAAAMGRAHVEREGVSVSHAASFLLVGTMNPEEGELRPQLLDRFGLTVQVLASRDVSTRTEVVRRRLAYEADPAGFAADWAEADAELAVRIVKARAELPNAVLPDTELRRIAAVCAAFEVDGMRADLVVARTAIAHCVWRGANTVTEADVEAAVRLALPHRRRRDPFDEPGVDEQQLQDAMQQAAAELEPEDPDDDPDGGEAPPDSEGPQQQPQQQPQQGDGKAPKDQAPAAPSPAFKARLLQVPGVGEGLRAAGPAPAPPAVAPCARPLWTATACTSSARSPQPPRTRRRGAVTARACGSRARTCAWPCVKARRATLCCSRSTPPAPWPHGSACRRSAVPCCHCCATPISAATRSAS